MNEDEFLEQLAKQDLSGLSKKDLKRYKKKAEAKGWSRVVGALSQGEHGPVRTFASDAADALTFNMADEGMAALRAPFSDRDYGDILSEYDAGRKVRASRNPTASLAGDITGNVAGTAASLLVPGAQGTLLARLASGGIVKGGAKAAALSGLSEGVRGAGRENTLGTDKGGTVDAFGDNAALGALLGGGVGAGSRLVSLTAKKLRGQARLGSRPPLEKRALRDISKSIIADRLDPVKNPIKEGLKNLNKEATLADSTREMQELGGALVRHSDATQDPLSPIVRARSEGAPDRISNALDRIVHPYSDALDFIPQNKAALKAGQKQYDEVLGQAGPLDITGLMNQNMQAAAYSGSPKVQGEVSRLKKHFSQKPFLNEVLDEEGNVIDEEIFVPAKTLLRSSEDFDELAKKSGGGSAIEFKNVSERGKNLLKGQVEGFEDASSEYERLLRDRSNFDVGAGLFRGRPDYDLISDVKADRRYDLVEDDPTMAKGMRIGMQELIDRSPRAHARLSSEMQKPITSKFLRDLGPTNVDKALAKELGIEETYAKTDDILDSARTARDRESAASLFTETQPSILDKLSSMGLSGMMQNLITLPSRGQRNLIKGSTPVKTYTPAANVSPGEVKRFAHPRLRGDIDNKMFSILASQGEQASGYADDLHKFTVANRKAEELAERLRLLSIVSGSAGVGGLGAYNANR